MSKQLPKKGDLVLIDLEGYGKSCSDQYTYEKPVAIGIAGVFAFNQMEVIFPNSISSNEGDLDSFWVDGFNSKYWRILNHTKLSKVLYQ